MKNTLTFLGFFARKIDRQSIQFALVVLSLMALMPGAGAPADGGGGR